MSSHDRTLLVPVASDVSAQLAVYLRTRATLQECLTLISVTSVSYALRAWTAGEHVTEVLAHVRAQLALLPLQFSCESDGVVSCVQLRSLIVQLLQSFEQHDLASYIAHVQGGNLFLASLHHLHELASELPSLTNNDDLPVLIWDTDPLEVVQRERYTVILMEQEYEPLRTEVVEQVKLQQGYLLAIFTVSSLFLFSGLQPGISGLVVMLEPIVGLGIAMKIAAHDLRVGQLNFYLRSVLRSVWEIWRRATFNDVHISDAERTVLAEQHIEMGAKGKKHELAPPRIDMQALANRWVFMTNYLAALGIGIIRTSPQVLHGDLLTIFVWLFSFVTTGCTWAVLQRKRIR